MQYMYSVIEKGDNWVKLVSLDEERRWLYCLLFTLLFTLHSINYWKFWCTYRLIKRTFAKTDADFQQNILEEIFECSIRWWMLTYWWLTMHFLHPHQRNLLHWNKRYCLDSEAHLSCFIVSDLLCYYLYWSLIVMLI